GIAVDDLGNLYVTDRGGTVRKVFPAGTAKTLAGGGGFHAFADGSQAINAFLSQPNGVLVDATGYLYVSDSGNCRIRKVHPSGKISTLAASGLPAGALSEDVAAIRAALAAPSSVAIDPSGTVCFSDRICSNVLKIRPDGTLGLVAGGGSQGDGGPARDASLSSPEGIAFDVQGNLYIAESGNHRIRRVAPNGTISTFAGNGQAGYSGD